MAITYLANGTRDVVGQKVFVMEMTLPSAGSSSTEAHSIDLDNAQAIEVCCRANDGAVIPNGNLGNHSLSDYQLYVTDTEFNMTVPALQTNVDGATVCVRILASINSL